MIIYNSTQDNQSDYALEVIWLEIPWFCSPDRVCPSCETQNPGKIKSCTSCGAPQPDDVEFLLVEEDKFNFIKDEALIRMAKAGPDIHCPYCGTRSPFNG